MKIQTRTIPIEATMCFGINGIITHKHSHDVYRISSAARSPTVNSAWHALVNSAKLVKSPSMIIVTDMKTANKIFATIIPPVEKKIIEMSRASYDAWDAKQRTAISTLNVMRQIVLYNVMERST